MTAAIVVTVGTFAGIILICAGAFHVVQPSGQSQPPAADAPKPVKLNEWIAAPDPVRVRITQANVAPAPLLSGGVKTESENPLLLIRLETLNVSPTKILPWEAWSGKQVTVSDEHGNQYSAAKFPRDAEVVGSQFGRLDIYPQKTVSELLVFQKPVAASRELRVELPGVGKFVLKRD